MSLRMATYPATAMILQAQAQTAPSPVDTGKEYILPSQVLLINHTGSEHPYIPPWWTGRGNDLPRALAQYLASAWIAPSPEPASACRGHRNMPCPICTFPQALGTRTCTCPSRRVWRGEWDDNNCLRLQRTESTFLQVLGFGQTSPFLRLLLL